MVSVEPVYLFEIKKMIFTLKKSLNEESRSST